MKCDAKLFSKKLKWKNTYLHVDWMQKLYNFNGFVKAYSLTVLLVQWDGTASETDPLKPDFPLRKKRVSFLQKLVENE